MKLIWCTIACALTFNMLKLFLAKNAERPCDAYLHSVVEQIRELVSFNRSKHNILWSLFTEDFQQNISYDIGDAKLALPIESCLVSVSSFHNTAIQSTWIYIKAASCSVALIFLIVQTAFTKLRKCSFLIDCTMAWNGWDQNLSHF